MAVDTSQFKNGLKLELDGQPFNITYFQHVKPGKGGAFVRTKLKNLLNGKVVDRTFRSGEKLEEADIEEKGMQYLYHDGEGLIFMDSATYDQIPIGGDVLGRTVDYLLENMEVEVLFWKGKPVQIQLPNYIVAKVVKSDPGVKGDTSSGASTLPSRLSWGSASRESGGGGVGSVIVSLLVRGRKSSSCKLRPQAKLAASPDIVTLSPKTSRLNSRISRRHNFTH